MDGLSDSASGKGIYWTYFAMEETLGMAESFKLTLSGNHLDVYISTDATVAPTLYKYDIAMKDASYIEFNSDTFPEITTF